MRDSNYSEIRLIPLDPISSTAPLARVVALSRHGRGGRAIRPGWLVPGGERLSSTSQYTVLRIQSRGNGRRKKGRGEEKRNVDRLT